MIEDNDQQASDHEDLSVPPDLLDLYVQLDEAGVTPEEFKEVYGDVSTGNKS